MTIRWTFTDPVAGDSYTMDMNPNAMSSLGGPLQVRAAGIMPKGKVLLYGRPALPTDWEFTGVLRTQAQYEAFVDWMDRPNRIHLTDHLGRTLTIQMKSFAPVGGRARRGVPWRHTYSIKALVFSVVNGPIGDFLLDSFDTAPTGATLDTTTAYQGRGSARVTLQESSTGGLLPQYTYSTSAPVSRTYASPWNLNGENRITMRMQWPDTGAGWGTSASLHCVLTLNSASGTASISTNVSFATGEANWHLATFHINRDPLTGTIGTLDLGAVTSYSLSLNTPGGLFTPRGTVLRLDNQRAKP